MESCAVCKIKNVDRELDRGTAGLFGFAVNDYIAALSEKGIDTTYLDERFVAGAVITPGSDKTTGGIIDDIRLIADNGLDPEILVFDYHHIEDKSFLDDILSRITSEFDRYEELPNVYECRIVLVKKDHPQSEKTNKKTIRFEIVTNDNEGVIDFAMDMMHKQFKGLPDYVDNAVVVSTDIPYDGKEFPGSIACVSVDLTAAKDPKECMMRLLAAHLENSLKNPGILGDVFDRDEDYVKNPDGCESGHGDCCECKDCHCPNHMD